MRVRGGRNGADAAWRGRAGGSSSGPAWYGAYGGRACRVVLGRPDMVHMEGGRAEAEGRSLSHGMQGRLPQMWPKPYLKLGGSVDLRATLGPPVFCLILCHVLGVLHKRGKGVPRSHRVDQHSGGGITLRIRGQRVPVNPELRVKWEYRTSFSTWRGTGKEQLGGKAFLREEDVLVAQQQLAR